MPLSAAPSWNTLKNKPTTVAGFGITDMSTQNVATAQNGIATGSNLSANLAGSSRSLGSTYTNTKGKPIVVYVGGTNATNGNTQIILNGSVVGIINGYGGSNGGSFVVPVGATYALSSGAMGLQYWFEYS